MNLTGMHGPLASPGVERSTFDDRRIVLLDKPAGLSRGATRSNVHLLNHFNEKGAVQDVWPPSCLCQAECKRRKCRMVGPTRKSWRDLANAALEAKDPDKLLEIVQELNKVLKHEEQVRRDFREAVRASNASIEVRQ